MPLPPTPLFYLIFSGNIHFPSQPQFAFSLLIFYFSCNIRHRYIFVCDYTFPNLLYFIIRNAPFLFPTTQFHSSSLFPSCIPWHPLSFLYCCTLLAKRYKKEAELCAWVALFAARAMLEVDPSYWQFPYWSPIISKAQKQIIFFMFSLLFIIFVWKVSGCLNICSLYYIDHWWYSVRTYFDAFVNCISKFPATAMILLFTNIRPTCELYSRICSLYKTLILGLKMICFKAVLAQGNQG